MGLPFADELAALSREPIWVLVLELDYCLNEYGNAPCTAAGGPPYCYYTYPTCQDKANFTRGSKCLYFCERGAAYISPCLPYIKSIEYNPIIIDAVNVKTGRGSMVVKLWDDLIHPLANSDKTLSNEETAGSFFRNLIARNPNYENRPAYLYMGFNGVDLADFQLYFTGVIESLIEKSGEVEIKLKDITKEFTKDSHWSGSDDNITTLDYSGGATLSIVDASKISDPVGVYSYPTASYCKVGGKYIKYTGVDTGANQLTGCAYAFGDSGTVSSGAAVKPCLIYAIDENSGPLTCTGLPSDFIFIDLIVNSAGISALRLKTVDCGITLTAGINNSVTAIPVSSSGELPDKGIVRINDELIAYSSKTDTELTAQARGMFGTDAAAHNNGDPVNPIKMTYDQSGWVQGSLFNRVIIEPQKIQDLINELSIESMMYVWQDEDGTITSKAIGPVDWRYGDPVTITDSSDVVDKTDSYSLDQQAQVSRVYVYYAPTEDDPGTKLANYNAVFLLIDADLENVNYLGRRKKKKIFAPWIRRENEASTLASRWLMRYKGGAGEYKFNLELKDNAVKVGDIIRLNSEQILNTDGSIMEDVLFEIIQKKIKSSSQIELIAMNMNLFHRYPVISPAAMTGDYDTATEQEQQQYGWIGNADNEVGAAAEDGYYIY